jgi:D-alanyl-D-alanine carboxypeptidase
VIAENQTKSHTLENLNQLLGEDGVIGIKTGYTEKSGENLVTLVERDGRRVLIVVLRSSDRFGETKKLIQWAYRNFSLEWR